MIKKFSFTELQFEQIFFIGSLAVFASQSEANHRNLTFPYWCPQEDSNFHLKLRKLTFYPLNYGGMINLADRLKTNDYYLCGGGEIRTHGDLSATAVFKTAPLNRFGTPP